MAFIRISEKRGSLYFWPSGAGLWDARLAAELAEHLQRQQAAQGAAAAAVEAAEEARDEVRADFPNSREIAAFLRADVLQSLIRILANSSELRKKSVKIISRRVAKILGMAYCPDWP